MSFDSLPIVALIVGITLLALVIGLAGAGIVPNVERISRKTGLGDSLSGALLIGIATSLSGTVLSVDAAWQSHTDLAISNALGGIVVQTFFLIIGDVIYRRGNIEHAAASLENMMQAALLILLLSVALLVSVAPEYTVFGISPGSPALFGIYLVGVHATRRVGQDPQWLARPTALTSDEDERKVDTSMPLSSLLVRFIMLMVVLGGAGLMLTEMTISVSARTSLSESLLGAVVTSTITSLPELVTTITAIRRGALSLAVGNIIGGNTFDVLFLSLSDVAYRDGSLFHAMTDVHYLISLTAIVMAAVLLLGLLGRQKKGPGVIGIEGVSVAVIFVLFIVLLGVMTA